MKKKKKIFWKIYWALVIVALIAIGVTWYMLHRFLVVYENAQPFYKMDEVLTLFEEEHIPELMNYETTSYDEKYRKVIESAFWEKIQGKKLSYKQKYGEHSNTNPVYCVYADGENVATVYLCADEQRGEFDSKIWNLKEVTGLVKQLEDIEITAPSSAVVEVDGEAVPAESIVSVKEIKDRKHYEEFISDFPQMTTYHVGNIYRVPEVKCYAYEGGPEIAPKSAEYPYYSYDLCRDGIMPEDRKEATDAFVSDYVKYGAGDASFSAISDCFVPGTLTYTKISMIENMLKSNHDRLDLSEVEIDDYVVYGKDAYKAVLKFTYSLHLGEIHREYPTLLTAYYAQIDGQWKIVEMYVNSNYE